MEADSINCEMGCDGLNPHDLTQPTVSVLYNLCQTQKKTSGLSIDTTDPFVTSCNHTSATQPLCLREGCLNYMPLFLFIVPLFFSAAQPRLCSVSRTQSSWRPEITGEPHANVITAVL